LHLHDEFIRSVTTSMINHTVYHYLYRNRWRSSPETETSFALSDSFVSVACWNAILLSRTTYDA
jgi:hypothetical protein